MASAAPAAGGTASLADSNMASYYTKDENRARKMELAKAEDEYDGAGAAPGLEIWRIEKFAVKRWDKARYGEFYSGDSYIVLNTWKDKEDKIHYDAHFWIGESSSQDEYGTAAFKTVELDSLLGDEPVQHREVQNYESALFRSYFKPAIITMDGGVDSGFTHVKDDTYSSRLLWVKGKGKNVTVRQKSPVTAASLNSGDAFILDTKDCIYQWNGTGAGVFEKSKAAQVVSRIQASRADGVSTTVIDEGDDGDDVTAFFAALGDSSADDVASAAAGGDDAAAATAGVEKKLYKYSDASGSVHFEEVATGDDVKASLLDNADAFLFDTGSEVFVWIGSDASARERGSAMARAVDYLQEFDRPLHTRVTRVRSGAESSAFNDAIGA